MVNTKNTTNEYGHCGICKVWFKGADEVKSHFSSEEHKTKATIGMAFIHHYFGLPEDNQTNNKED